MKRIFLMVALMLAAIVPQTGCKKTQLNSLTETQEVFLKSGTAALAHTKQYKAEVATAWFHFLTELIRTRPYAPPPTARFFAYSGMALYESVVPGMPSYQSMYTYFTGNTIEVDKKKEYYWPATANAAMAGIISKLMLNYSASANLAPVQQLENQFNSQFQLAVSAEQLQHSINFGKYVAEVIYNWSKTDGTLTQAGTLAACPPYMPLGGPQNWVPTPPGLFPAAGGCQGSLRTFIPGVVATTLPPPPPAYSTVAGSVFYNMAAEVKQRVANASADDLLISQVWRDLLGTNYNTPAHLLKLSSQIIDVEGLDLEKAAEIYGKQGIANFDAVASAFHAKFHYALLRPVTYIRNAMGVPTWNSVYPTPQHPSYPAVAPGAAGSIVVILEKAFGTHYAFSDSTQKAIYGTFNYNSFNDLLKDVGRSRSHNGLNFQLSVDEGIKQGRRVGEMISLLPFKK